MDSDSTMTVWFAIPSARPPAEAEKHLAHWRALGYKLAIFRDHPESVPCDLELRGPYPGYYAAINRLAREILANDARAEWIVSGGDDTDPDLACDPLRIAQQCAEHFGGTLGVMQPTGDRWGERNHIYAENVAGSPWLGREWCLRAYQGKGPVCEEYRHYYGDEELQNVAKLLGRFQQRRDLIHYHDHYLRGQGAKPRPAFHVNANRLFAADGAVFRARKQHGFPGHELL
jgi:hypothetical protein